METLPLAASRKRGLIVEGFVMCVSILLAFFLEGWREDRALHQELVQELESVQRELESNRTLAAAEVEALERVASAGVVLLDELRAAAQHDFVAVQDTLVTLAVQWRISYGPSLGAVEALISSGRLAQVESPELRSGLAGLRGRIVDVVEDEVAANHLSLDRIVPLLVERMDMGYEPGGNATTAFLAAALSSGLSPQEYVSRSSLEPFQRVDFPTDRTIRNYVATRIGMLSGGQAEFRSLVAHLDDLIALVREELD